MDLKTPLKDAGFKYKQYAGRLEKLEIETLEDLLFHFPSRYEDRTNIQKIKDLVVGEDATIKGTVLSMKNTYTRRRGFTLQTAVISDETGEVTCTWFNQPYLARAIQEGKEISISGEVDSKLKIKVRDFEITKDQNNTIHTGRLVPIYPATKNVSVKWLRSRIAELLPYTENLDDPIPDDMKNSLNLTTITDSLTKIHFPQNLDDVEKARRRFAFEELLLLQLASEMQKREWKSKNTTTPITTKGHKKKLTSFINSLPFKLTTSQIQAIDDITNDLDSQVPMNRLLQGDVGSGKTVVAAYSIYLAFLNKKQSAYMAPTEILTLQHYETIKNLLTPLGVKVSLRTGSKKLNHNSQKDSSNFDVIIGTHALLSKAVTFKDLGLVIIDEQQRFGVEQRALLREKGNTPHFLTMTATPIPRTVFLAMYGELNLSYLNTLPTGRKKIKTWVVPPHKRQDAYTWITKNIEDGASRKPNQVFILCPFIDESESMTSIKAATTEFQNLKDGPFKKHRLALLHGRLKSQEKEEILKNFRDLNYDILVTTPVVEVGIDIPNATIMLIEGADRFGLAQLHQLRGRVGRNDRENYCLLFTDTDDNTKIDRLKNLERIHLGSDLAEVDLKLRGPGEMYGTKQSGKYAFQIARITDSDLLSLAQIEARKIADDPDNFKALHNKLKSHIIRKISRD